MNLRKLLFFSLGIVASIAVEAQNLSQHNWYFGNKGNAIRFNRATNKPFVVTNNAITVGTGGTAVATDPLTGDILFYTDGVNVYNANHQVMPNGSGLNANTGANQPVVLSSKPHDSTKFYIFTNTAHYPTVGSIYIDTVDMNQFGGSTFPSPPLGDVIAKNKAMAGLTGRSEGMIVIPTSTKMDTLWLITHKSGSQDYAVTRIDKTRTFPTTVYTIASNVPPPGQVPISVANFSYNKRLKKLAVSPQNPNADALILNFDETTGALTWDRYIYNTGQPTTTGQSIYNIQWDNAGQYLYISRVGETGINADVFQYDYLNPGNTLVSVLKSPEYRSWGLQLAPDSTIYHIYQTVAGGPY
ncbi:MAG TPA: hypothetical protein DGG95_13725, partial [Cytophagales bacterium]|nr:hypothetical protein [Cytophagales bacterium]